MQKRNICDICLYTLSLFCTFYWHCDKTIFIYVFFCFFSEHIIDDDQATPYLLTDIATHIVESHTVRNDGRLYFNKQERGKRYIYLIVRILHAVSLALKGDPSSYNFVKCMRVFHMTISDPFVCLVDVRHFLQFLWVLLPFNLISIVRVFDIYIRLFKNDNTRIYGPRSLKHLCRVSVRNCLRKNMKMLPQSVRSLHIPRALHDYLLCIMTSSKDFTCGYMS